MVPILSVFGHCHSKELANALSVTCFDSTLLTFTLIHNLKVSTNLKVSGYCRACAPGHTASQGVEGSRWPAPGPYKHEAVLKTDLEKGATQKYQMTVCSALSVLLRKIYLVCLGASYITES